jgi:hypothetical protein
MNKSTWQGHILMNKALMPGSGPHQASERFIQIKPPGPVAEISDLFSASVAEKKDLLCGE